MESPLLVSMQAVAITLIQMLWVVDLLCRLVAGVHVTGVTSYMLDPTIPRFLRGLSSFHGWLPFSLLWLLSRLGYDRRALAARRAHCDPDRDGDNDTQYRCGQRSHDVSPRLLDFP
jgi:hypothetical protein